MRSGVFKPCTAIVVGKRVAAGDMSSRGSFKYKTPAGRKLGLEEQGGRRKREWEKAKDRRKHEPWSGGIGRNDLKKSVYFLFFSHGLFWEGCMIDTVNARGNGLDLGDLSAYPTLFGAANPKLGSRLTLGTLPTRLHISRTTGNQ